MKIIYSSKAGADYNEIMDYYEEISPEIAENFSYNLNSAIELICKNPFIGREIENKNEREWPLKGWPYLIPYKIKGNELHIIRIYHTSRNPISKF